MSQPVSGAPAGLHVDALPRYESFDGLRGLIIITVVLGHTSSYLWPADGLRSAPVIGGLVGGGAVTVFFVISGFLATRTLLQGYRTGSMDPSRFFVRRLIRVGAQVLALCVVILLVGVFDETDTTSNAVNTLTVSNSLTFTTNWLFATNPLEARPDMGHLWFTSVQQQWYLILPLIVLVLGRRPLALGVAALLGAVLCAGYRVLTLGPDTWFALAIDVFARADGLLLGVALGALLPVAGAVSRRAHGLGWLSLIAIPVLLAVSPRYGALAFLDVWGVIFTLTAALMVATLTRVDPRSSLARVMSLPPLGWLGRSSLVIYIWHYPIIFLIGRHTQEWTTSSVTVLFIVILGATTWLAKTWIQDPVSHWLRNHLVGQTPPSATPAPLPGSALR